jgi:cellulose synthase/poly-beta-1,6-N-acetylglucosamine synthase-like glycosyltransferase
MILDGVAVVLALIVATPLWVIASEGLLVVCGRQSAAKTDNIGKASGYAIVMPAHNEAAIINNSLQRLLAQIDDPRLIYLVVDNCTDTTANIARSLGVNVLERSEPDNRGKGFALAYGIEYLRQQTTQPDIVVFLDADCEINRSSLHALLSTVRTHQKPAQAVYLMRMGENPSIKRRIAGFAWLVKNKIRPLAMHKLGLPVILTGTGMAFPWQIFASVRLAHGNIVEDLQLGIDCTLQGMPPVLCGEAEVFSDFPEQQAAEHSQRTRWEHGHLQTIIQQIPFLLLKAIQNKDWRLLALALDIGVPPLSLLVMITMSGLMGLALLLPLTQSSVAFYLMLASFGYFSIAIALVWWRFGLAYLSAKDLLAIPLYVVSKFSIYKAFVVKREKNWVRTDRDA